MNFLFKRVEELQFTPIPTLTLWLFVFLFLVSLRTSFFLQINEFFLIGFFSILFYFVNQNREINSKNDKICISVFFLLVLAAFLGQRSNMNGYIGVFIVVLPVYFVLKIKEEYRMALLQQFNKIFAILVAFSFLAFVLYLLGVPLLYRSYEWNSYLFHDYTFFMTIPTGFYALQRFQFIFTEPGYFGCLMVFLIYLNKYDFMKWEVWVFFFALICTYSLAGYLLFFFGLAPFVLYNSKSKFKYFFILVLLFGGFVYLNGSSDDNFVTQMFSYRLQFDNDGFSNYNRTSDEFEKWFSHSFVNSGRWMFGANEEFVRMFADENNVVGIDLRAYISRYGLLPLFFYFGSMIYYYRKYCSKFGLWYLFLFVFFYYRGYTVMYYIGFAILYYLGIQMLKIEKETGKRIL